MQLYVCAYKLVPIFVLVPEYKVKVILITFLQADSVEVLPSRWREKKMYKNQDKKKRKMSSVSCCCHLVS